MKPFIAIAVVLSLLTQCYAKYRLPKGMKEVKGKIPRAQTIEMPIDHFTDSDTRTYSNRYWINSTYYQPGGPVFIFDNGEAGVAPSDVSYWLMEGSYRSSVMQLAQRYNGLGLLWEHRFYGQSLPFPLDNKTGIARAGYDAYQYLTTEQALEDVVYLAEHFKPVGLEDSWKKLQPDRTPWIFIGGSYPGSRAAYIRSRNPDTIYASWSSSGPVQATVDMAVYNEQLFKDTTANCSADIRAASQYLDNVLTNGTQHEITLTKALLSFANDPDSLRGLANMTENQITRLITEWSRISNYDAGNDLLTIVPADFQSFGFVEEQLPYCNILEQFDPTSIRTNSSKEFLHSVFKGKGTTPISARGIAATHGIKAAFLAVVYTIGKMEGVGKSITPAPSLGGDDFSWGWQTCSEYGYFQVADPSSKFNYVSKYVSIPAWQRQSCELVFGYPQMPAAPDVGLPNKYGGWHMTPSNVMFTNGLKDPWHNLGVQSHSAQIGAPMRKTVQDVPKCNEAPDSNNVFGLLYPNGYHVSDFGGGPGSNLHEGLALFTTALDRWLPCFAKRT